MLYLGTFGLQFENNIVIFEINALEFVYLQTFAEKKAKMLKFGIKNALFGYFLARNCDVWNQLEFVKVEFLTHTVHFGIGSVFSKCPGSVFSEGPGPGPGPLYKVCHLKQVQCSLCQFWSFWSEANQNFFFLIKLPGIFQVYQSCYNI